MNATNNTPNVTVGVPIYNGGDLYKTCLENLQRQTYRNFKVLIYDNVSTDDTEKTSLDLVARDRRFKYHKNEKNIGSWPNFSALLDACDTEYFIWRAYDDYTDDNFLEEMVKLLDSNSDADLATSRITSLREGRKPKRITTPAPIGPKHGLLAAARYIRGAHPSWFYGLWRTAPLRRLWADVMAVYPHSWGGDHVILFEVLYRGRIAGSNATTFYQRLVERDYKARSRDTKDRITRLDMYRNDAKIYLQMKKPYFGASHGPSSIVYEYLAKWFVDHRIYSARKLRRMRSSIS